MIIAVKINKTYNQAKNNSNNEGIRKSIKDMVLKYWKLNKAVVIAMQKNEKIYILGVVGCVVYAAFEVEQWRVVRRLNKRSTINATEGNINSHDIYSDRIEFFSTIAKEEFVGLYLGDNALGGWGVKIYDENEITCMSLNQDDQVRLKYKPEIYKERNMLSEKGIDYNPLNTYSYENYYYGNLVFNFRDRKVIWETHERSNYTCERCKEHFPKQIECHHIELISRGGNDSIDNTISLCERCHTEIHKNNMLYENKIKEELKKIRLICP